MEEPVLKIIDIDIPVNFNKRDVLAIIQELKLGWASDDIQLKSLGGGFVNQLVLCVNKTKPNHPGIVCRIFGESFSKLHDRQHEKQCTQLVSRMGLGPKLLCTFNNGTCYEFVDGKSFEWNCLDYKDEHIRSLIINEMVKWHSKEAQEEARTHIMDQRIKPLWTMRKILDDWPQCLEDPEQNRRFQAKIPPYKALVAEVDAIEKTWTHLNMPKVFCHNDINMTNIVYKQEAGRVFFLDYEWSGFSAVAWDIAYHINACHSGTSVDVIEHVPTDDYIRKWVETYLQTKQKRGDTPSCDDADVEKLTQSIKYLLPMTQFIIGLIATRLATLPPQEDWDGFDYIGVAAGRFDCYFKTKLNHPE